MFSANHKPPRIFFTIFFIVIIILQLPLSAAKRKRTNYLALEKLQINNEAVALQLAANSKTIDLDQSPELKFKVKLPKTIKDSFGLKVYKSTEGVKGRLISMRNPSIRKKKKFQVVEMPLNEVKMLSEIRVEVSDSDGNLINSYQTSITATSAMEASDATAALGGLQTTNEEVTAEDDDDETTNTACEQGPIGPAGAQGPTGAQGVAGAAGADGAFTENGGVVYADNIDMGDDHFVFGSNQVNDAVGTDDDSRMMFIQDTKVGAFRAGTSNGDHWDLSNIGASSVALGYNVKSSGTNSISIGTEIEALGNESVGIGNNIVASQSESFAIGNNVSSTHTRAFVIGSGNSSADPLTTTANDTISIGFNSNAATLFIGSSAGNNTTGRVGIGTTSPHSEVKLDINGSLRLQNQASRPTCNSSNKGILIFYNNLLYGCNGNFWENLN